MRKLILVSCLWLAVAGSVSARQQQTSQAAADLTIQTVNIIDFGFSAPTLTVPVGTSVTWANTGAFPHTTTSDQPGWDSGSLSAEQTFSHTFDTPGTFAYHCEIHKSMTGTIIVAEAETENKLFLPRLAR